MKKSQKTMLSKLFTQSHQAEKFKLRLISGFNQNKLYCSFKWTVKPLGSAHCGVWSAAPSSAGSLGLEGAEPGAASLCRAAFGFCSARTSARLPGQAPVTAPASPVSQERGAGSGLAGADAELSRHLA